MALKDVPRINSSAYNVSFNRTPLNNTPEKKISHYIILYYISFYLARCKHKKLVKKSFIGREQNRCLLALFVKNNRAYVFSLGIVQLNPKKRLTRIFFANYQMGNVAGKKLLS